MKNSGISFYSYSDLLERNETYEVKEYEPSFFMIAQDGDLAYFLNILSTDSTIYSNGLGSLGSLKMEKEADNIDDRIKKIEAVIFEYNSKNI